MRNSKSGGEKQSMVHRVIEELDAIVSERNLLKHPLYQAWTAGELPMERLRNYAVQYYGHVAAFPRYLSAIHSRCSDLATRQAILENLIEEERGAENHPELWLRFAEAIGVPRDQVQHHTANTAAQTLVRTYENISSTGPLAAGLAALYAYESQIPAVASAKIAGLCRFYGIRDDRGVAFFQVHQQADVCHAKTGAELIEGHCADDSDAAAALHAGHIALDALWAMLDAV